MAAGPDLASPFFVRWNTVGGVGNFLMVQASKLLFEAIPPSSYMSYKDSFGLFSDQKRGPPYKKKLAREEVRERSRHASQKKVILVLSCHASVGSKNHVVKRPSLLLGYSWNQEFSLCREFRIFYLLYWQINHFQTSICITPPHNNVS